MELVRRGWRHRRSSSWTSPSVEPLKSYGGGGGYGFLIESFLLLLRERGADDALIDTLTRENPRSLFR